MPDDVQEADASAPMIKSVEDLMGLLTPLAASGREVWFRGHRDVSWRLEASVFRTAPHRRNERAMLARFRQEAASAGLQYAFDYWGWIAFAQHHSLPTRLLDWSQSPLVALYFACEQGSESGGPAREKDAEFFILYPNDLNKDAGDGVGGHPRLLVETDRKLTDYLPGKDAEEPSEPRAVIAPLLFDRIRFQTGTFTISQTPPVEATKEPLRGAKALQSFVIPGTAKEALRGQLSALGFNEVSIYRDLDRIANRIKSEHGRGV